jgi:hypothetical protein
MSVAVDGQAPSRGVLLVREAAKIPAFVRRDLMVGAELPRRFVMDVLKPGHPGGDVLVIGRWSIRRRFRPTEGRDDVHGVRGHRMVLSLVIALLLQRVATLYAWSR